MRLVTTDKSLDCTYLKKPALIHRIIANDTKGRDLVQLQEDHKLRWTEYHFQMVIDVVAFEAIVAASNEHYIEELKEDYAGYNNQMIKTMLLQLQTWFVIMKSQKLAIKAHFHAPWSVTPNSHITTFARQLNRCQIECSDHGVTITDDNKVVYFIQEMYVCGLFKDRFLDDWEENTNKSWKVALPLFTAQFNKEQSTIERQHRAKTFESSNVFRERGAAGSFGQSTATTADS